jgi:hypothetical protein
MPVYFLKRDPAVYKIRDQDSLERLVRLSLILPKERLKREGERRYRAADSFPELKPLFAMDAWDTWAQLADEDPDEVWNQLVVLSDSHTDASKDVSTAADDESPSRESVSVSDSGLIGKPAQPLVEETIVFPSNIEAKPDGDIVVDLADNKWQASSTRSPVEADALSKPLITRADTDNREAAKLPDDLFIHQALSSTSKKPPRRFSLVFVLFALIGAAVLVLLQYTVRNTAQWNSVANTRINRIDRGDDLHNGQGELVFGEGLDPAQVLDSGLEQPSEADSGDEDLEPTVSTVTPNETQILIRTLRSQISGPPREMSGEADDLTAAMMLDLSRLRARVNRLRAPVTLWGGPEANVPLEASIDVWLNSSGDVLRDVAVVALAVGRIVQYHDTVVTGLELTIVAENEPPRRIELSGPRAAEFYQNQITFSEFIEDL